jgi:hypothetical protein
MPKPPIRLHVRTCTGPNALGGSRRAEQRLPRRATAGRGVPVSDERRAKVSTLPFALLLRLRPLVLERMHKPL